jgi:hypothetical protein
VLQFSLSNFMDSEDFSVCTGYAASVKQHPQIRLI